MKIGDDGPLDNTPVYDVPAGHYFGMGDNRARAIPSFSTQSAVSGQSVGIASIPLTNGLPYTVGV
jgi:hypothetical protein